MNFKFKNLSTISEKHPLEQIGIGVNGITILKGEKGSAKSTAARVMFCIINGFYNMDETVSTLKISKIKSRLRRVSSKEYRDDHNISKHQHVATELYNTGLSKRQRDELTTYVQGMIHTNFPLEESREGIGEKYEELVTMATTEIVEIIKRDISKVMAPFVMEYFDNEFKGEISNVHTDENVTEITVETFRENLVTIKDNKEMQLRSLFSMPARAFYLDTPFALDAAFDTEIRNVKDLITTRGIILRQEHLRLFLNQKEVAELSAPVKKILERITKITGGTLTKQKRDFKFIEKNKENGLRLVNVSTSLKVFMMIGRLLETGSLTQGGTLILDKMDMYLDEKYKKYFDVLIVALNKELDIKTVLISENTEGIEVLLEKENVPYEINMLS